MSDKKYICVFGASNSAIPKAHIDFAEELGAALAKNGFALVFGAGTTGLMGAAARGTHSEGGEIIGVIPKKLNIPGIYFEHCTERIETETMHERKALMEDKSDAFIALGGGFGTLEELMEVITLKQLGYIDKEIIIVNLDGFYDNLLAQFDRYVEDGFTHGLFLRLYTVAKSVNEVIAALKNPEARIMPDKMQEALLSARFSGRERPEIKLED
ncbi:MAG: TIGR00730 family Rossman fold protein [Clostridia bacterium]|nr:TIGR00730 family Rossman fold protein [Clostridia bacterium]